MKNLISLASDQFRNECPALFRPREIGKVLQRLLKKLFPAPVRITESPSLFLPLVISEETWWHTPSIRRTIFRMTSTPLYMQRRQKERTYVFDYIVESPDQPIYESILPWLPSIWANECPCYSSQFRLDFLLPIGENTHRDFKYLTHGLYLQHLEKCLEYGGHLRNICWMSKWSLK